MIGVAGTVTTIAAMALACRRTTARSFTTRSSAATASGRGQPVALDVGGRAPRAAVDAPGRADVIGAGALILYLYSASTPVASMLVSECDILDGIAWSQV